MPSLLLERRVAAPIDVVWNVLTDHRAYPAWGAGQKVTLEVEGSPDANGTGAIRRIEQGPVQVREKILDFEPPRRFQYTVLSGPPVRDYLAEVWLTERDGGTFIRWTVEFEPKILGTGFLVRQVVAAVIRGLLKKAIVEAERRAKAG